MASEAAAPPPPPPPPPPPADEAPAGPATAIASSSLTAPPPSATINPTTLTSACTALERLRSLNAEQQACALLASSLLAHPLGASGTTTKVGDDGEMQVQHHHNVLKDPLLPSALAGGVRDAWASLSKAARPLNVLGGEVDDLDDDTDGAPSALSGGTITAAMIEAELAREKKHENEEYTLGTGQLAGACRLAALHAAMTREGEVVEVLEKEGPGSRKVLEGAQREVQMAGRTHPVNPNGGNAALMDAFYRRVGEVKAYHSQNTAEGGADAPAGGSQTTTQQVGLLLSGQKRKHGHPLADGYDLASLVASETAAVRSGEAYTPEELFGKYLDLVPMYEGEVRNMRHAFAAAPANGKENGDNGASDHVSMLSYLDFLSLLSKGLNVSIPEAAKLRDRRKYARFLRGLEVYLTSFLKRTSPFLDVASEVVVKSIAAFEKEWGEMGGVEGWECRMAEASMAGDAAASSDKENGGPASGAGGIDLSQYATAADLEKGVGADELKSELARLGLKCGGAPKDRAARLFLTKDTPLDQLPAKVFAKKKGGGAKRAKVETAAGLAAESGADGASASTSESISDRRVDIARSEAVVTSLLDQLRPILDATRRRIERRTTQTDNERDQELEEEINGAADDDTQRQGEKGEGAGSDDEDEEDDTPIYNPKNVPLDWNGKPIPYWLFKLHGLNHFYPCEICGNESYRGRRNFEKHFTESRHAYGMRCLQIPNTKHFHGVTKIADAQELWGRLRKVLEGNQFDVDEEEEYEDSHGNVLNRAQYEDLARQGLL